MKPCLKLLLFGIFLPAITFAQSNFKPGYVVTLKGDTLRGEIDYKEWIKNPKSIYFKNDAGQVTDYTPANTSAFSIKGIDYYERFIMPISMDETEFSRLHIGPDSTKVIDTVFLRIITKGKNLTLYTYNDQIKSRYIIWDRQSAQPAELNYHTYLDSANNKKIITRDPYKNELVRYAMIYGKNDPSFLGVIRRASYNDDIIKIVNKINGDDVKKVIGKGRGGIRFFAGAVLNSATLKYAGNIELAESSQNKPSYAPELNFGIDLFQNANVGKLFFRFELGFCSTNFTTTSSIANINNFTRTYAQTVVQRAFAFKPQIIYNVYNSSTIKAFLGSGLKIDIYNYTNNLYVTTDEYGIQSTQTNFPKMRRINLQIPINAGVTIHNKLEVYGQYCPPTIITDNYLTFSGSITTFGLGINYLFQIK